jgi:surface polysaccharide O-acyltransferase-like enzyme
MLGIYVIMPILKAFINGASKHLIEYFILLWFIFQVGGDWAQKLPFWDVITINFNKLNVQLPLGYVGYYVLGYYLHRYPVSSRVRRMIVGTGVIGVISSVVLTIYECIKTQSCNENFMSYFWIGIAFWSMAVFVFVQAHEAKFENLRKMIEFINDKSMGIYVSHMLFIMLLWDYGVSTFSFAAIFSVPVLALIVLAASVVLVIFLKKIPGVKNYVV